MLTEETDNLILITRMIIIVACVCFFLGLAPLCHPLAAITNGPYDLEAVTFALAEEVAIFSHFEVVVVTSITYS